MTKDEKLDKFLRLNGIELSPVQKELLKQIVDCGEIYICYPPYSGRTYFRILHYVMTRLLKGETDGR